MTSHAVDSVLASATNRRPWATSSFADAADTTPLELSSLGAHVDCCNGSRGRMFALHCAADSLIGFIAPRFVTTLVVVVFAFGVVSLVY